MIEDHMLKLEIFNSFKNVSQRFKVLLIDDEIQSRIETESILKENNFLIEHSSLITKAVEQIKESEFDLVMCSPRLLNAQGTMLIETGRKQSKPLPVIIAHRCVNIESFQDRLAENVQSIVELPLNEKGKGSINRTLIQSKLTEKEILALKLYNKGIGRRKAAEILNMSEHTYAWHLKIIRRKFGIKGRQAMMMLEAFLKSGV